jgi:murein DD-endopeptidase MepM/ murein hydrolase activator NlpD
MLHLPAIMPVSNKDLRYTGSGFGMRFHPILRINRMHEGIDFIAPGGSEVYATADGVVTAARVSRTFGNIIEIDHGFGYQTLYAHLKAFNVKAGQAVKRGQVIAWVGNTGLSAGTHLHYEVHHQGKETDPVHYFFNDLSPGEYERIIKLASENKTSLD